MLPAALRFELAPDSLPLNAVPEAHFSYADGNSALHALESKFDVSYSDGGPLPSLSRFTEPVGLWPTNRDHLSSFMLL